MLLLFLAGLLIAVLLYGSALYKQRKAEENFQFMAEETNITEDKSQGMDEVPPEPEEIEEEIDILETLGIEIPEKDIDFAKLQEEYPDIYAWIYVPGTQVDYPVFQHPTDDTFYLNNNADGSAGYPGCIYTESINSKNFTDPHTVLYGHNMKNKTMFGSLHNFEDSQVFEENPYFFIYTPDKTFVYQIFATYRYPAYHLLYAFDLSKEGAMKDYQERIIYEVHDMTANIRKDIKLNDDNHIVTLSTCVTGEPDYRYLVQGVLLNDGV